MKVVNCPRTNNLIASLTIHENGVILAFANIFKISSTIFLVISTFLPSLSTNVCLSFLKYSLELNSVYHSRYFMSDFSSFCFLTVIVWLSSLNPNFSSQNSLKLSYSSCLPTRYRYLYTSSISISR